MAEEMSFLARVRMTPRMKDLTNAYADARGLTLSDVVRAGLWERLGLCELRGPTSRVRLNFQMALMAGGMDVSPAGCRAGMMPDCAGRHGFPARDDDALNAWVDAGQPGAWPVESVEGAG